MLSEYHENSVMTSIFDGYCLVCEVYLPNFNDINCHIVESSHIKNLGATPYFEKYKVDNIRKVKHGYYCEFCNKLCTTPIQLKLHVSDSEHQQKKIFKFCKRTKDGVLIFGKIFICDEAWNGIAEGTCLICNQEIQDSKIHKSGADHVIKLINSKVYLVENSVYRIINNGFQCLTCNKRFALGPNAINLHFEESYHKSMRDKYANDSVLPKATTVNADIVFQSDIPAKKKKASPDIKKASSVDVSADAAFVTPVQTNKPILKQADVLRYDPLRSNDYIIEMESPYLVHCILCNKDLMSKATKEHINSVHHQALIKRVDAIPVTNENSQSTGEYYENICKIFDSCAVFQNNDINVNFDRSSAICKKCSKSLNFKFDDIQSHIEEHKRQDLLKEKKIEKVNSKKASNAPPAPQPSAPPNSRIQNTTIVGNATNVSLNENAEIANLIQLQNMTDRNDKVHCNLCNLDVNKSLKALKEHLDGLKHKIETKDPTENASSNFEHSNRLDYFTSHGEYNVVYNILADLHFMAIDDKYAVAEDSFNMIKQINDNEYECFICQTLFKSGNLQCHIKELQHLIGMQNAKIIEPLASDMVTEIRHGVLHCGYCNLVLTGWTSLKGHLETNVHKETRQFFQWNIERTAPEIRKIINAKIKM